MIALVRIALLFASLQAAAPPASPSAPSSSVASPPPSHSSSPSSARSMRSVPLVSAAPALSASLSALPDATVARVPKWSLYEVTLTASDRRQDPYVEVDLIGVFTGPHGESIVVGGFWDGGRTFRVRFTPPSEGVWTFSTVSSDEGLDGKMGSFICTEPEAGVHGFVRGGAASPMAWTFDDGTPASGGRRVVRVRDAAAPTEDATPGSMVRDRLALATLRTADGAVQQAQANGEIAEVAFFAPDERSSVVSAESQRLLDYLIARYGAYANVVWCLDRRGGAAEFTDAVRRQDPYFADGTTPRVLQASCDTQPPDTPASDTAPSNTAASNTAASNAARPDRPSSAAALR